MPIFTEDIRKHIDIVEATITRMGENSKHMKEWCIALTTGLISAYVVVKIVWLLFLIPGIVFLFRHLDAFYLMTERRFRYLYNDLVGIGNNNEPAQEILLYDMSTKRYEQKVTLKSAKSSPAISPFYWSLFYGSIVLSIVLVCFTYFKSDVDKNQLKNGSISVQTNVNQSLRLNIDEDSLLKIKLNKVDSLSVKIDRIENLLTQQQKIDKPQPRKIPASSKTSI